MSNDRSGWLITAAYYAVGAGVIVPVVVSIVTPLALGTLTVLRQSLLQGSSPRKVDDNEATVPNRRSTTLLTGRVWHSRFHPKRHSFSYPFFIFGIDLDEETSFNRKLWPLSLIMNFSSRHHLINGEGSVRDSHKVGNALLRDRIYALVHDRTGGKFAPTATRHQVWLVTHLSYYGYCFNPVSFYYIMERTSGIMQAVVAEVSNTPWIEMYPYVLHPDSSDEVQCIRKDPRGSHEEESPCTNYKFPKTFHVSPFMEMQYTYDWFFQGEESVGKGESLRVTTAMIRTPNSSPPATDEERSLQKQFTATMRVKQAGLHPLTLAWQLARYPSYCFIVQLWIHYEAFWLFWKGIEYQPHPEEAETTASRIIGAVMTPLFKVQDWLSPKRETDPKL